MDPHNDEALASKEALEYWSPVDWYNGGMEHTTLHLLYSRFWHKFLYDLGVVPTKEPYAKRTSHGMILGEGGIKMSKSRGNVINPTDVIAEYGADTMRTYIVFIGDFEKAAAWSSNAVKGCKRFLDKVWNLAETVTDHETSYSAQNESLMHKTIKKVSSDSEIDMAVQVNGKLRGTIHVAADLDNDAVVAAAEADPKVARFLEKLGGSIVKTIVVKNKLVNLIVKP